jgi:hypothetical protein
MDNKLTLRLGESLIGQAKKLAKRNGMSLSQMVADYFHSLAARFGPKRAEKPLTPLVASLRGSLRACLSGRQGRSLRVKDYRRHLEEKYL